MVVTPSGDPSAPSLVEKLTALTPRYAMKPRGRRALARIVAPGLISSPPSDYTVEGFLRTGSLFVHIPKAAGNSVAYALYGPQGAGHETIGYFQDVFRSPAIERFYTFTFVRNPWDRVFSAYSFLKRGGWQKGDQEFVAAFLSDCDSVEKFVLERLTREDVREKIHFKPLGHFLKTSAGEWFPFDFVGRFERFADDFETVKRRVNPQAVLKHRNRTNGVAPGSYLDGYTSEMIDAVARIYAEDIEAFGYTFDGYQDMVPKLSMRNPEGLRS